MPAENAAEKNSYPHVIYKPFTPSGGVLIPPSKSDVHRAIICAALSGGRCTLSPVALSNDIKATIGCIEALGAKTSLNGNSLIVDGTKLFSNKTARLNCMESGSTLRFFIPVAAYGGINTEFTGSGLLPQRPIGVFTEALPKAGVNCDTQGGLPLRISGKLKSGKFEIPGNISSQFITGLLFVLPLLDGDSEIILTSPIESESYIDMTVYTMKKFGVNVERTDKGWHIMGGQHYTAADYVTDGDWSQAAFFMVSAAINGKVTVNGVHKSSVQGDREIANILARFGARVTQSDTSVTVESSPMKATVIDASQIPDLVPALAVCACFASGVTRIINAQRLRYKESDRLKSTADMLNSLGGKVKQTADGLEIEGVGKLNSGVVNGCNDHRIVMSAAACAACLNGEIECTYANSINKSYPDFFRDYNGIGGKADVINIR